jgi:hypothetical protein
VNFFTFFGEQKKRREIVIEKWSWIRGVLRERERENNIKTRIREREREKKKQFIYFLYVHIRNVLKYWTSVYGDDDDDYLNKRIYIK